VPFRSGTPSGPAENFLTGFIARDDDQKEAWGRPVGLLQLPDGLYWCLTTAAIESGGSVTRGSDHVPMQIDHVELFVRDRHDAAHWYRDVLGLEVVDGYQEWADDPRGPLMISSDGGTTKLALFIRRPQVRDQRPASTLWPSASAPRIHGVFWIDCRRFD
jgi:hypothetical protein